MDEQNNFPRNSDTELPAHLQVSHDSDKNPWRNLFMQDFVLVAEFSEHEGPKPLVSELFKIFYFKLISVICPYL